MSLSSTMAAHVWMARFKSLLVTLLHTTYHMSQFTCVPEGSVSVIVFITVRICV